jgi:hypothetical protein
MILLSTLRQTMRHSRMRWPWWIVVAGAIVIVGHGCHGDEDHELIVPLECPELVTSENQSP